MKWCLQINLCNVYFKYINNQCDRNYIPQKLNQYSTYYCHQIKEDIIDNLNITQETWMEEKRNRELLQEHIRTITDVVRKLNRDITVCNYVYFNMSNNNKITGQHCEINIKIRLILFKLLI